jgi:hypothetical protein
MPSIYEPHPGDDPATAALRAFVCRDESKQCPFCSKSDWGAYLHSPKCPFRMAYDVLEALEAAGVEV